jgi:predicted ATPase
MYTISVTNFGPIRKSGPIEIRPLTVFVGPSNAGKSYLAAACYALLKSVSGRRDTIGRLADTTRYRLPPPPAPSATTPLIRWLEARTSRDLLRAQAPASQLPEAAQAYIVSAMEAVATGHARGMPEEIERTFSTPLSALVRFGAARATLDLTVAATLGWDAHVGVSKTATRTSASVHPLGETPVRLRTLKGAQGQGRHQTPKQELATRILTDGAYELAAQLTSSLPGDCYYLPASRSGLLNTRRLLAGEVLSRAARVETNGKGAPDLQGLDADFLAQLVRLRSDVVRSSNLKLVDELEAGVTHGRVEIEEIPGGFVDISYSPDSGGRIPVRLAGSMVSDLAPLALFLRHLVLPDDLLIIEEPEAHLHPESQLALAAIIAGIVRIGIRVLITTHSDLLLGQLNNLVAAHALSPQQAGRDGIRPETTIAPENVAAYVFDRAAPGGGTVVRRLPVSATDGIPEDVFTGVIEQLYAETIRISSDLEQAAAEG